MTCWKVKVEPASDNHSLKGGELRYHSSKLKFLTLKWAITEQFKEYLQYPQECLLTYNTYPSIYIYICLTSVTHAKSNEKMSFFA